MKSLIIVIFLLLLALLITRISHAQDSLSGQLKVNFQDETASYTETYDFSDEYETKTSASVPRNPCNYCLEYFEPSACLEVCVINN